MRPRASKRSLERAKLAWITAMIRYQLSNEKPWRLRVMMEKALETFLDLGMALEAVAIVADMARMVWSRPWYTGLIREILSKLAGRLHLDTLAPEVQQALAALRGALDVRGFDAHNGVRDAIVALRDACSAADEKGQGVLACLVTFAEPKRLGAV